MNNRDHGGGLDAAIAIHGGTRADWVDLSTGINPVPYPVGHISAQAWTALPDSGAQQALVKAARTFWQVPDDLELIAAPGASALIAQMPRLANGQRVRITGPTYNEHAASFRALGWDVVNDDPADACVVVHPNNPTGALHDPVTLQGNLRVIDESFCDTLPASSLMAEAHQSGTIILKSFGKFWGLAGVRLGFAIGNATLINQLAEMLGPWPVAGPALEIGRAALADNDWAAETRLRLTADAERLDLCLSHRGARVLGGTTLFRLYHVEDAAAWQTRLAKAHVWSRIFPYDPHWLRLGLPGPDDWAQLETALR